MRKVLLYSGIGLSLPLKIQQMVSHCSIIVIVIIMLFKLRVIIFIPVNTSCTVICICFSGRQIDGIWHTAIVAYGREYFFGPAGIQKCRPVSCFNCCTLHSVVFASPYFLLPIQLLVYSCDIRNFRIRFANTADHVFVVLDRIPYVATYLTITLECTTMHLPGRGAGSILMYGIDTNPASSAIWVTINAINL